jgi:large subunit ribosomal protein L1
MARSKLYRAQMETYDRARFYPLVEAVGVVKKFPHVKFDETVELAVKLGIDTRQSDQAIRGALALPHGTGKNVRVVVAAEGDAAKAAREAGADEVGFADLLEKIQGGWLDFDVMIATPDAMREVRKLGRVLGPRGLMPNPKTGTVSDNPAAAVREAKGGRIEYRADRGGCIHVPVGKVSFTETALKENIEAVIQVINRARPPGAKGTYLVSCTLASTMSPGVRLDAREFTRS